MDYQSRRRATLARVKLLYDKLAEGLVKELKKLLCAHVDCFLTCNKMYFIMSDLYNICENIVNCDAELRRICPISDNKVIHSLLTFTNGEGEGSAYLSTFDEMGIKISLIQYLMDWAEENQMTVFNISDVSISKKVLVQVILKPRVKEPIRKSLKRPRVWLPTLPGNPPSNSPSCATSPIREIYRSQRD